MPGGPAAPLSVSVVVPVKDEAGNVAPLAREIAAALKGEPHEILFVDDGSTDGTAAALAALKGEIPELRVLRHSRNLGQSRGIRTGVQAGRGEIIVTLDIVVGDESPSALLSARPALEPEAAPLGEVRVDTSFNLTVASARAWIEGGYRRPG